MGPTLSQFAVFFCLFMLSRRKFLFRLGVVPWLTERQAKCPLCKFDVAEYLRQYQAEQGIVEPGATSSSTAAVALWNPLTWVRYRSWTAVAADATEEGHDHHHHSSAPSSSSSSSSTPTSTGSAVYDDEERQTVVMELAEHAGTLT